MSFKNPALILTLISVLLGSNASLAAPVYSKKALDPSIASAILAPAFAQNITAAQILSVSPVSQTCDSSGQFSDECRTAEQAAPFINVAFVTYNISTVGEQAAVLSLMTFESGGFQFNRNHFPAPGNPGQGTRNMMNFPFIMKYAQDTPEISDQANNIAPDPQNVSDDAKNAVLALVLGDDLSFASAAWFLKSSGQCGDDIVKELQEATESGWEDYITGCVGTTVTDDRKLMYLAALSALQ